MVERACPRTVSNAATAEAAKAAELQDFDCFVIAELINITIPINHAIYPTICWTSTIELPIWPEMLMLSFVRHAPGAFRLSSVRADSPLHACDGCVGSRPEIIQRLLGSVAVSAILAGVGLLVAIDPARAGGAPDGGITVCSGEMLGNNFLGGSGAVRQDLQDCRGARTVRRLCHQRIRRHDRID